MDRMITIGQLAARGGVSPRMLRHWDALGLLPATSVDAANGYRYYAETQIGRVRAIAALRALDFDLATISELLDAHLTESQLLALLRTREQELAESITSLSSQLSEVQARRSAIENASAIVHNQIELGRLDPISLLSLSSTVSEESQFGAAAHVLLERLDHVIGITTREASDVLFTYYGPPGGGALEITAGVLATDGIDAETMNALTAQHLPAAEGARVHFPDGVSDVGAAWASIDSALAQRGLAPDGVYRLQRSPNGATTLSVPVTPLEDCAG